MPRAQSKCLARDGRIHYMMRERARGLTGPTVAPGQVGEGEQGRAGCPRVSRGSGGSRLCSETGHPLVQDPDLVFQPHLSSSLLGAHLLFSSTCHPYPELPASFLFLLSFGHTLRAFISMLFLLLPMEVPAQASGGESLPPSLPPHPTLSLPNLYPISYFPLLFPYCPHPSLLLECSLTLTVENSGVGGRRSWEL